MDMNYGPQEPQGQQQHYQGRGLPPYQPHYTQQQPWSAQTSMYARNPPPSMMPPLRKKPWYKRRSGCVAVSAVILFIMVLCGAVNSAASAKLTSSTASPKATSAPIKRHMAVKVAPTKPTKAITAIVTKSTTPIHSVATATPTVKSQPTILPTQPLQATAGNAILGSDIGPFITKFGQATQMGNGAYDFQNHTIEVLVQSNHSFSVLDNSPGNTTWSETEAKDICLSLSPSDAKYVREMTLLDGTGQPQGIQFVYLSPSLATKFPASDFTDEHLNSATPGTFGIVINYMLGSTSQFLSCSTQVGLQGV